MKEIDFGMNSGVSKHHVGQGEEAQQRGSGKTIGPANIQERHVIVRS